MSPGSSEHPLLSVRALSIGFDSKTIVSGLEFDVPAEGIFAVMGPGGVGKTTLLRTLGRWNEPVPGFWVQGSVHLGGADLLEGIPLEEARRAVPLLSQKARLYTATVLDNAIADVGGERPVNRARKIELAHGVLGKIGLWAELEPHLDAEVLSLSIGHQRCLAMARLMAGGARCLLVDEPLRDLSTDEAERVEQTLVRIGELAGLVMVTHNQKEARRLASAVCLIAAGRMVETTPTARFFSRPTTELGARFLRSGNCWPAASDANTGRETDHPETEKAEAPGRPPSKAAPGGFHWIVPGLLGGMQLPGLLNDVEEDLGALAGLGAGILVSLTETPLEDGKLASHSIEGWHFPIVDMEVPTPEAARELCSRIVAKMDAGIPVVLHCKAGLGRTGTMLACVLVARGADPVAAIHQVRCTNPLYIQSEAQLSFVGRFTMQPAA